MHVHTKHFMISHNEHADRNKTSGPNQKKNVGPSTSRGPKSELKKGKKGLYKAQPDFL